MSDLRHTRVARNIGISLTHWGFELFDLVLIVFAIIVLGFVGRVTDGRGRGAAIDQIRETAPLAARAH